MADQTAVEGAPMAWRGKVLQVVCPRCEGWQMDWDDTFALVDLGGMALSEAVGSEMTRHFAECPAVDPEAPRSDPAAANPAQRAVTVVLIVIGTLVALLVTVIGVGALAWAARAVWTAVLA